MSGKFLLFISMAALLSVGVQDALSMPSENSGAPEAAARNGKVHADVLHAPEKGLAKPKKQLKTVVFSVNMHCEKCVEKIRENISFEKGVKGLDISLEKKTVTVKYDASRTDLQTLSDAISKLGYEVEVKSCPEERK